MVEQSFSLVCLQNQYTNTLKIAMLMQWFKHDLITYILVVNFHKPDLKKVFMPPYLHCDAQCWGHIAP